MFLQKQVNYFRLGLAEARSIVKDRKELNEQAKQGLREAYQIVQEAGYLAKRLRDEVFQLNNALKTTRHR